VIPSLENFNKRTNLTVKMKKISNVKGSESGPYGLAFDLTTVLC
jgi:hypothetical protein